MMKPILLATLAAVLLGCGPKDDGQPKASGDAAASNPVSPQAQAQADFMKKSHGGEGHTASTGG